MLRRLLWNAIYAVLAAVATLIARQAATRLWRLITGEPPPVRKR